MQVGLMTVAQPRTIEELKLYFYFQFRAPMFSRQGWKRIFCSDSFSIDRQCDIVVLDLIRFC